MSYVLSACLPLKCQPPPPDLAGVVARLCVSCYAELIPRQARLLLRPNTVPQAKATCFVRSLGEPLSLVAWLESPALKICEAMRPLRRGCEYPGRFVLGADCDLIAQPSQSDIADMYLVVRQHHEACSVLFVCYETSARVV